jgi:hypothetical protein
VKKFASALIVALVGIGCAPTNTQPRPGESVAQKSAPQFLKSIWTSDSFTKSRGVKEGAVTWKADKKDVQANRLLKEALRDVSTEVSNYTMNLSVVGFEPVLMGSMTVEGQVVDAMGQVVATFQYFGRLGLVHKAGEGNWNQIVNSLVDGINTDLLGKSDQEEFKMLPTDAYKNFEVGTALERVWRTKGYRKNQCLETEIIWKAKVRDEKTRERLRFLEKSKPNCPYTLKMYVITFGALKAMQIEGVVQERNGRIVAGFLKDIPKIHDNTFNSYDYNFESLFSGLDKDL